MFKEVKWTGLRCRVMVEAASSRLQRQDGVATIDLRRKANDPSTSVAATTKVLKDGKASLLVDNDELEGEAISLVVLDSQGQAFARMVTVIGGEK